ESLRRAATMNWFRVMAGMESRISIMRLAVKKMTEIKRLLKYSLDYKWWFIAGNILMVLMVFFQLLGPLMIMKVIDDHIRLGEGNINVEADRKSTRLNSSHV